ncbi:MAG: hypothetical protein ACTJHE_11120 [Vibrio casei]
MKIKLCLSAATLISLTACSLIPPDSKVEPTPFDDSKSYALNVASQTALTLPYYYGRTYSSPLRDFTDEERKEASEAFEKQSNAGSMLGLAGVSVLTGNFMGAAMTAGSSGLIAVTTSKHIASKPTWIIAVEKSKFTSELEAQKYIVNTIEDAVVTELSKFGEVKEEQAFKNHPNWRTYLVKINDEWIRSGFNFWSNADAKLLLTERQVYINGKLTDAYTYGYGTEIDNLNTTLVTAPLPTLIAVKSKTHKFNEIVKGITSTLPVGFNIYYTPHPMVLQDKKYYIDRESTLPSIYSQGNKYEFLKP